MKAYRIPHKNHYPTRSLSHAVAVILINMSLQYCGGDHRLRTMHAQNNPSLFKAVVDARI
jgi:hypothetical protein